MKKFAAIAGFLAVAVLFLLANSPAYTGFFQGDELDSLSWAPHTPAAVFAAHLVSPLYSKRNFRPFGHFYFRVASQAFGLDFPKYLLPLHLIHLLNVWLLLLVLRNLRASPRAAAAGAIFFAFHLAVFDVYWKPMYAFDLFCGAFCLLSLLFWIKRRWLLAFLSFWLAYKSKELAVMLPAVLACYELAYGKRQWRPLVPFFLVAASFGLQGIFLNPNRHNDYTFRFTAAALAISARFYAGALFGVPLAGFVVLTLPALYRDRRGAMGVATAVLFLAPLLFLPGRLFSAYWYVPLIGIAIAFSSVAEARYAWPAVTFLGAWLPYNYFALQDYGRGKLAADATTREYVEQLRASIPVVENDSVFLYHGLPPSFAPWGIGGALNYFFPASAAKVYAMDDPGVRALSTAAPIVTLVWEPRYRQLWISAHERGTLDSTYIFMSETTPVWQLTGGWYAMENGFRWTAPRATARLYRAARATQFEVVLNRMPEHFQVLLNGEMLPAASPGAPTQRWPLAPGPAGPVEVEFQSDPPLAAAGDPRVLGAAIASFGFLPSGR